MSLMVWVVLLKCLIPWHSLGLYVIRCQTTTSDITSQAVWVGAPLTWGMEKPNFCLNWSWYPVEFDLQMETC